MACTCSFLVSYPLCEIHEETTVVRRTDRASLLWTCDNDQHTSSACSIVAIEILQSKHHHSYRFSNLAISSVTMQTTTIPPLEVAVVFWNQLVWHPCFQRECRKRVSRVSLSLFCIAGLVVQNVTSRGQTGRSRFESRVTYPAAPVLLASGRQASGMC